MGTGNGTGGYDAGVVFNTDAIVQAAGAEP